MIVCTTVSWLFYECSGIVEQSVIPGDSNDQRQRLTDVDTNEVVALLSASFSLLYQHRHTYMQSSSLAAFVVFWLTPG